MVRLMGQSPSPSDLPLPLPPFSLSPSLTQPHPSPGAPQIRQRPRLFQLRRQSANLARTKRAMDQSLRLRPAHGLGEHRVLVPARERLPPGLRLLRRQRQRARVQGQQLGAQDLPGARDRRERRELGAGCGAGEFGQCRAGHESGPEVRYRGKR